MNRLHVANSFGLRIFEAASTEDLYFEEYMVLVETAMEINAAKAEKKTDRSVSIRTRD